MASTSSDKAWPNPGYAWYVIVVLAGANLFSAVDRTVLNLLMESIKRDLVLTDTQIGLIQGAAFGLVHTTMILPFGWLADRTARNRIITFGITFWSLMTAACGLAASFWQLFIARMGVGVGEATMSPTVPPLISDFFPREKRTFPIAVYTVLGAYGTGIAYLVGGAVSGFLGGGGMSFPFLGELRPWQAIFVLVGLPGLLWALLTLTVRDPTASQARGEHIGNAELWRFVKARFNILGPHFIGNTIYTVFSYGMGAWTTVLLIRIHGWSMSQVGFTLGAVYIVMLTLGGSAGGLLSQKLLARGLPHANLLTMAIGVALLTIPGVAVGFVPNAWGAIACIAALSFFTISVGAPSIAAMQEITPPRLRGRISAIYYATTGLVGLSFGGAFIGALTDYVFKDEMKVGLSISLAAVSLLPLAAALVYWGARSRRALGEIHDSDLKFTVAH